MAETTGGGKKKSWAKRVLIGLAVAVVLLVVGAYVLVPVIASAKAPGLIEQAAAGSIKGTVKVGSVSVGWGGPVVMKDVELRDPEGKRVGILQVESSLGIWKVLGGLKDLGTAKVSGRLDVVRTTDASGNTTTNLERAIAGKTKAGSGSAGGSGGATKVPAMSGTLEITGIDATFEDRGPGGVVGTAAMKGLKGMITFSTDASGSAEVKLDAAFGEKLDGASTGLLSVKGAAKGFVSGGALAVPKMDLDTTVTAKGAPVSLIDALANQGGVLSGALGATADATVKMNGPLSALNADVVLEAPNATADLAVTSQAGRLRATRKGSLTVKSLAFVEKVPSVASALKDAGVTVTKWPGVTVAVNSLDIPAGGGGEGTWAGAKVEVSAFTTGEVNGTVARKGADGKPGVPEALVVKPVMMGVIAPDIVKGVEVIGNTEATIGGQSAGALDLNVQLTEVIGADGKLAVTTGAVPGKLIGTLQAKSVSTNLLAPLLAGAGVPLDLPVDVGPTLDLTVNAKTTGGSGAAGAVPPTEIALSVASANIQASGTLAYDATGLGVAGEKTPVRVVVQHAAPLMQRLLSRGLKEGEKAPVVSGAGKIELTVTSARLPVSGKKIDPSLASFAVGVTLSDLTVRMGEGGSRPVSVGARSFTANLQALPRTASPAKLHGQLLLDGRPMDVNGELRLTGLMEQQDLPRLGALGTGRVAGFVAVKGVPGASVQGLVVGAGASDALKHAAAELVGSGVDVRVDFGEKTTGSSQPVGVTLTGPALSGAVQCELKNESLEVSRAEGNATVTDALAQAVLELAGQKGEAVAGAHLRGPAGLSMKVEQPITVPLKAETLTPEWSRAKSIVGVTAGLSKPAIVDGVRVDGRSLSAGVANCSLNASVPLSILDTGSAAHTPGAAGLKLAAAMDLIGKDENDVLARLRADGGSGPDGSDPRVNVSLTDVATARLDEIAGQGGLLPGLLGDTATVVATVSQQSASGDTARTPKPQTEIGIDVQSPLLTLTKGRFVVTNESYAAAGPFAVSLTASPALVERFLAPRPDATGKAEPASLRVGEPVKTTLNVSKLVLSASGEDKAGGPLKPGVFAIDAVVSSPRIVLVRAGEAPGAAPAPATGPQTTELTDFTATVKSTGTASKSGVEFSASVGSIKSGGQVVTDPTVVRGSVDDIADVGGNVRTETAVVNLKATTGKIPTALIESLTSGSGRMTELLGSEITADIEARDLSKTGASGFLSARLKSPKASLAAGGPVSNGVLDTAAPGATPLRIELNEFEFEGGGKVLSIFPIFAQMQRAVGESNKGPAVIASRDLKLPIDGDMTKFNGAIDVDIGRVDYEFSQGLGGLLDATIFRGGKGLDQPPVPKFTINIDKGVMRYGSVADKVTLPVRNLNFKMRGVVDLVRKQLDVVTYVPTAAAAPGLLGNLNHTIGGVLGKISPGVIEKITDIPVRTQGPLESPRTAYSPQLVLDEFKDALKPENLIKGIGDLLGGNKEQPTPKPAAPSKPPTGPTAPKKKK